MVVDANTKETLRMLIFGQGDVLTVFVEPHYCNVPT
jgi:hypothetical protein